MFVAAWLDCCVHRTEADGQCDRPVIIQLPWKRQVREMLKCWRDCVVVKIHSVLLKSSVVRVHMPSLKDTYACGRLCTVAGVESSYILYQVF